MYLVQFKYLIYLFIIYLIEGKIHETWCNVTWNFFKKNESPVLKKKCRSIRFKFPFLEQRKVINILLLSLLKSGEIPRVLLIL